jgi:DNA invertase Pin-like site-specific DNA recombinase
MAARADTTMRTFVAYLQVSTGKWARSDLDLADQLQVVAGLQNSGNTVLEAIYVERKSRWKAGRPQLDDAISRCRRTDAVLFVANARLTRDAAFLTHLLRAKVVFQCAGMPLTNWRDIAIMAWLANKEHLAISARTKAALQAARARGVRLGGDHGYRPPNPPDAAKASVARIQAADRAACMVAPDIRELQARGLSLQAIAAELATRGFSTPRGGAWTAMQVSRIIKRTGSDRPQRITEAG